MSSPRESHSLVSHFSEPPGKHGFSGVQCVVSHPAQRFFAGWNGEKQKKIWRPSPSGTSRQLKTKASPALRGPNPPPTAPSTDLLHPGSSLEDIWTELGPPEHPRKPSSIGGRNKAVQIPIIPSESQRGSQTRPRSEHRLTKCVLTSPSFSTQLHSEESKWGFVRNYL